MSDEKRPLSEVGKEPKAHLGAQSVTASGDVTIGNIRVGDIVGDSVITGNANTVTVTRGGSVGISGAAALTGTGTITIDTIQAGRYINILPHKEMLPVEMALGRIADAVRLNLGQLQLNMEQARKESGQFFKTTLVFAAIGFLIILVGVGLMLAGLIPAGIVTTAASVIPQAGAFLLFNKDKELRRTIESYHGYILDSQRVLTMIDLAETIGQEAAKDSIKEQIILAVLKVKPVKTS